MNNVSMHSPRPADGQAHLESPARAVKPEYEVLSGENRTQSKSFQSKLKNLLYTLSTPFRAALKTRVEASLGNRMSPGGVDNVKTMTTRQGEAIGLSGGQGGYNSKIKFPPGTFS